MQNKMDLHFQVNISINLKIELPEQTIGEGQ